METGKTLRTFFILIIVLFVLITPQVHSFFITQQFNKSIYPDGTLVITSQPTANFPRDWHYCYEGQNELDALCMFYNVPYEPSLVNHIDDQLALADIDIRWTFDTYNENDTVYFDFEFENIMTSAMDDENADFVLVFADLVTPQDEIYGDLGGYARVQINFAIVFCPMLSTSMHKSSLGLHEVSHLLGYWHSDDPDDVMYPMYTGFNNDFTQDTIDALYDIHH